MTQSPPDHIAQDDQKDKMITVLNGAVKLLQIEDGFKTSIDAVLLAAACPAKAGERILDLGCGVGSAGLSAIARINDTRLTGVDIQLDHVEIATKNAAINNNSKRCVFINESVQDYYRNADQANNLELFDHVICNPPYEAGGHHFASPSPKNALARGHQEEGAGLEDWVKCAFRCVKSGGSFTLIHKAEELPAIIRALGKSFGATEIIPLWPKQGKAAKRVIIRTIKHRKSPATLHAGLVLHNEDGSYTAQANDILRNMAAL
jgi:tRNA1(Val) A37 N6-methylase TrmN6